MEYHIRRDDGQYLVGGFSTQMADKPQYSWAGLDACTKAIDRYRLTMAFYAPERKNDGFTILHYRPQA